MSEHSGDMKDLKDGGVQDEEGKRDVDEDRSVEVEVEVDVEEGSEGAKVGLDQSPLSMSSSSKVSASSLPNIPQEQIHDQDKNEKQVPQAEHQQQTKPPSPQHTPSDPSYTTDSHSLMSVLDARRVKIKEILDGKSSSMHQLEVDLKAKSQKNREDRVSLARQLNEIHESHKAREQRRIEVERELGRIQRQNLVNDIMYRKQLQADHRSHLENIESNEVLLLQKLEAVDEERARRQAAKIASVQEVQDRFAPVLGLLQVDESEAKNRVERIAAQGTDNLDEALARELQKNISVKYQQKLDDSTEAKHKLTSERFEVEAQLRTRTERLHNLHEREDEAGTEVPFVYGQDTSESMDFKALMSLQPPRLSTTNRPGRILTQARSALAPHPPTKSSPTTTQYKNYSFKNTLKRAKAMDDTVKERVDLHQIRLEELQSELEWVKLGPQTDQWKKITARSAHPQVDKSKALLDHFVATQETRAEHRSLEDDDSVIVALANIIYLEVLDEGCAEAVKLAAKELLSVRVGVQRLLESLVVKCVSGLHERDRPDLQISGRSHLLRGCTRDVKESTARHRGASSSTIQTLRRKSGKRRRHRHLFPGLFSVDSDIVAETCPARTQRLVYGNQRSAPDGAPPPPFYNQFYHDYQKNQHPHIPLEQVNPGKYSNLKMFPLTEKIPLWQHMLELDDLVAKENLIASETTHFEGLTFVDNPSSRLELPVPSELRGLCLLRCFARANKCMSLLVMGAKNGRFAVYSVPWQGSGGPGENYPGHGSTEKSKVNNNSKEIRNDASAPTLVCLSPSIFPTEVSPVVDIQETTLPSNQLISLDAKGAIRVWCLNPVSKRKSHSATLFSRLYSKFSPIYASCTFYVTPVEFNLPRPTPISFFNQLRGAAKGRRGGTSGDNGPSSVPQKGTFPQKVILMPTTTSISGRTPSMLVGTSSGNIFKINMDFKEKYFAPKFIYPSPFVDVEFMHSASVTKGADSKKNVAMILAAADKRKSARGRNPVYREMFHFHTSPIVLLECLGKVNNNILSIDAEGKMALWAYTSDLFEGQGWFRPLRTAVLDLRYLTLTKLKVSPVHPLPPQTPHPDLEVLLQPMRRRKEGDEIVETFQPIRGVPNHPRKLEVQYHRHTAVNVPSTRSIDQLVYWTASNVTSSLLSSGVLDVKMTQDGEEVVLLMTYEGLLDDGSGNVNLALTELQRTETLRQRQEARMSRSFNKSSMTQSSFGESGDYSAMGYDDQLDEDSLVDRASLDMVTDSEGENEPVQGLETIRHTADDFGFWMRDRDEQRASLKSLDLEDAQKDLQKALEPKSSLARDISTIMDHEKHNLYGATVNPTWNNNFVPEEDKGGEEGAGGQPTGVRSTKMFAVVACLNLESWRFHTPLVQFTLNTNELVMGMHLGPVQRQTLTRGVFVQTTNQLRVFSLETGNEIISNGLPVTLSNLSKSKKTFKPLLGALCPLQSMVIFGCAAQSMVVINKIDVLVPDVGENKSWKRSEHDTEGGRKVSSLKAELVEERHSSIPLSAIMGLKRKANRLRRVVHDMYIPLPILSPNVQVDADPWLLEVIAGILDDVFDGIWVLKKEHTRGQHAAAVLGPNAKLGVISPTLWPDPALLRAERQREQGEPGNMNVMMAVYRGAAKFKKKMEKVSNKNLSGSSSSDDSSSEEGVSSEYESDDSSSSGRSSLHRSVSSVGEDDLRDHEGDVDEDASSVEEEMSPVDQSQRDDLDKDLENKSISEEIDEEAGGMRQESDGGYDKNDGMMAESVDKIHETSSDHLRKHSDSQRSSVSHASINDNVSLDNDESRKPTNNNIDAGISDNNDIASDHSQVIGSDDDSHKEENSSNSVRISRKSSKFDDDDDDDDDDDSKGNEVVTRDINGDHNDNDDDDSAVGENTDAVVDVHINNADNNIGTAEDDGAPVDKLAEDDGAPIGKLAKKPSRWGWGKK